MNEFKVGDKVLAIKSSPYGITRNDQYVVSIVDNDGTIKVQNIDNWHNELNFTKVDQVTPSEDIVSWPKHYNKGSIQPIDFIDDQQLGFYEAQILKYTVRAKHKGNELQDLQKALWYLKRKIKQLESTNDKT